MSDSVKSVEITKDNLDEFLKEVAKEYRKLAGKSMPAEIVLVGGAAVLVNYGFRVATTDVDALIYAASAMKDAVTTVGDRYGLPADWLNTDFIHTGSYTEKIVQYSGYYRTFSNVLTVRTVSAEYLVAMKLRSGRPYKHDLSDIVGILKEHETKGTPITKAAVQRAVNELYGDWEVLPARSKVFAETVFGGKSLEELYEDIEEGEKEAKNLLLAFEQKYPGAIRKTGASEIVDLIRARQTDTKEES